MGEARERRPPLGPGRGDADWGPGIADALGARRLPAGLGSTLIGSGLRGCSGEQGRRQGRVSRAA
jgi:hypothetical protein